MKKYVFLLVFLCIFCTGYSQEENRETKQHPELSTLVRNWAQRIGGELRHFGEFVTRRSMVIESFKSTTVAKEDGEALLKDIHERISNMMKQKVEAVKRIMDIAEQAAQAQKEEDIDFNYQFVNAKNLTNSLLNTTTQSTPEVQELQYQAMVQPEEEMGYQQDQNPAEDVLESENDSELEVTDGTEKDPLASQVPNTDKSKLPLYRNRHFYNIPVNTNFSAVHVPSNVYDRSKEVISGIIWSEELDKTFKNNYKLDPTLSWQYFGSSTGFMRQFPAMIWSQEPIDLFDCRTRSWFIEAASSPKDIVILVDRSGSMTGMRREIARHVVHNILDTLGNNDYVNIYTFSNTTEPLVECFDDILVQANLGNVRLLKEAMTQFKTEQIANFSLALTTAFELLEKYRENHKGANCNQAIMLITDGVQYNYQEIFQTYNWEPLPNGKIDVKVRVFTYLIGREVSDVREVKWMACANRGFYVHLSTYAEVREEVLNYIPVMARPMVLNPNQKPNPTWSPIYADVTDPKLTNWLWINRERNRQRERFLAYRRNRTLLPSDEQDKKFVHQQKYKQDNYGELQTYHLMTSVSLPVYDKKPRAERVANLLGVAGTDIPIEYIQRLMMAYRLGVNGYAFIVSNNGYILTHPDLRPVYLGILKPAYNRVDITEVEIMDDEFEPREYSEEIKELRRKVIMQEKGNVTLKVKSHLDEMRRVVLSSRHYYYMGLNDTPFSLVIALPHKYGFNRIQHAVENDIHRIRSNDKIKGSLTQFFTGNWTIHPDWHYCRYPDDRMYFETPEQEFLYFLKKMEGPGWKWVGECDRKLICKVVADALVTSWFSQNITTTTKEENGAELIRKFGITVAFLATHSGLTRWQDFPQNIDTSSKDESHFHILHNKAIDEIWYKRAVEHYFVDPLTFLYSVPFDVGHENNTLITVSHAIFREDGGRKSPVAVIGYQFYHSALYQLFTNITFKCSNNPPNIPCKKTCESNELHCLMLDDNGYVITSNHLDDTGKFFGEIRSDIMAHLVDEGVYKVIRMFDYQGLCPDEQESTSPATTLFTPFTHLLHVFHRIYKLILLLMIQFTQTLTLNSEDVYALFHKSIRESLRYFPCDQDVLLHKLDENFVIQDESIAAVKINHTNLILLVFDEDTVNFYLNISDFYQFKRINYNERLECKLNKMNLTRRFSGICFNEERINPLEHLAKLVKWMLATILYMSRTIFASELLEQMAPDDHEMEMDASDPIPSKMEKEFDQRLIINKTKPEPCDNEMFLYKLVHHADSGYNKTMSDCTRPFIVQRVLDSNMILLVINNLCRQDDGKTVEMPDPEEIEYSNMSLACYRNILFNEFPRRTYMSCIKKSDNEDEIKICGSANRNISMSSSLLICLLLFYYFFQI